MNKAQLRDAVKERINSFSQDGNRDWSGEDEFVLNFVCDRVSNLAQRPGIEIQNEWKGSFLSAYKKRFSIDVAPVTSNFYNTVLFNALNVNFPQQQSSENPVLISGDDEDVQRKKLLAIAGITGVLLVLVLIVLGVISNLFSNQTPQEQQFEQEILWQEAILISLNATSTNLHNSPDDNAPVVGSISTQERQLVLAYVDPQTDWAEFTGLDGGQPSWAGVVYEGKAYFRLGKDFAVAQDEKTGEFFLHRALNNDQQLAQTVEPVQVPSIQSSASQPPKVELITPSATLQGARNVGLARSSFSASTTMNSTFLVWFLGFVVLMQILTLLASFLQGDVAMFWGLIVSFVFLVIQAFVYGFEGEAETWISHIVFLGLFPIGLLLVSKTDSIAGVFARKISLKDFLVTSRWDLTATATYLLAVCVVYLTLGFGSVNLSATIFSWVSWFDVLLSITLVLYLIESIMRAKYTFALQSVMFLVIYFTNLIPSLEGIKFWVLLIASILFGLTGIGAQIIGEEKSAKFFKAVAPELEERGITDTRARVALALDYQIDPLASFLLFLFFLTLHFWGGDISAFF